ncbi:cellulase family glycosylhydrolase [Nostoc sp. XA010]|uniref:cellulase family glycosylhydrolase n=1 Tax=Nostoc sp. XA010 TaxID=2780407 RepID=UPI001E2BF834|nr:cellulase family glycosylhydrolase [Nostoc sp. XA010]MCC5659516.1 cellulase family glycosylhydrolase [Nostoc sp. XA010]
MLFVDKNKSRTLKLHKQLLIFFLSIIVFLVIILTKTPVSIHLDASRAATPIELPLSTIGRTIVDAKGKVVLLRGVNWFGMETDTHAPHGLWKRDYKEMLAQIKNLGYNVIRLPYSVAALRSLNVSGIDYTIGSNKELQGRTPLEVMDLVIQEAERQGLLILLDSHRLNDQQIPELWYGDGFTEADWIDTWTMLAIRYKNQTNVIGADLKNEPYGKASWGDNNISTDWRLAAERAGNAILGVNPNWLIVVEGVEKNVPGQKLPQHWHGGNLEGVKRYPVRLSRSNKLVYSPHEYGAGVYNQPYFSASNFPKNLISRWQIGFNYIASQNIAPILIGEFGGRQVDLNSKEGIWQNELVQYIQKNNLSFTYWSWNPDSSDTGGILLDDWQSVNLPKQQLLSQLLPLVQVQPPVQPSNPPVSPTPTPSVSPSPTPSVSPTPTPSVSPSTTSTAQLKVITEINSNWETGFCVSFKIKNQGNTKVNNWQLAFKMNQAKINSFWNADFKQQGAIQYVVAPLDWGKTIEPNQVRDTGFCANKLGSDYQAQQISAVSI